MNSKEAVFTAVAIVLSMLVAPSLSADEKHTHQMDSQHMSATGPALTEPGNDAFGTIQEVVRYLEADPRTDWSRVNLEALRQHLIDMNNFTLNVDVVHQRNIDGGVELDIKPTTPAAVQSLVRVMAAHPGQVQREAGWDMDVQKTAVGYRLRVTSPRPQEAAKIRGLGYIGIMALGNHHPAHHWAMAIGLNPH
jgi:hypothetical protein